MLPMIETATPGPQNRRSFNRGSLEEYLTPQMLGIIVVFILQCTKSLEQLNMPATKKRGGVRVSAATAASSSNLLYTTKNILGMKSTYWLGNKITQKKSKVSPAYQDGFLHLEPPTFCYSNMGMNTSRANMEAC